MPQLKIHNAETFNESEEFVSLDGERHYLIRDIDSLSPFFVSLASRDDHWLFISSTTGLTAGRVAPEFALFPYLPVDKIHESNQHTGALTYLKVGTGGQSQLWAPFFHRSPWQGQCSRNIYKNLLGSRICFEETRHDLNLTYRLTWTTSEQFGFVASSTLINQGRTPVTLDLISGIQNILPANTPRTLQETSSNLVDAYKRSELDLPTGLATFSLYSAISDRAQANESMRANTVFNVGLTNSVPLISQQQVDQFLAGESVQQVLSTRGVRGLYFSQASITVRPNEPAEWATIADVQLTQQQVQALQTRLSKTDAFEKTIQEDIEQGQQALAELVAGSDGLQRSTDEKVTTHHYANALFNIMRGGTLIDQYMIHKSDFLTSLKTFNRPLVLEAETLLQDCSETLSRAELMAIVDTKGSKQLQRLAQEYLPISFGRRHGDPSRPWNHFEIKIKEENGRRLLAYAGNWRDIFQNWEALSFSFPEFIEHMIAKFVNASTLDGYNPYRVTHEGIDWEIEDIEDPWSYIGYWGDHQIIYLLKFLELSNAFHPGKLASMLKQSTFAYANVPYRIKPFNEIVKDPKDTVIFDAELAVQIDREVERLGADGKLWLTNSGEVYQATLLEKLLVPLLTKISNLVVDGGIWLNTQRPEWNDGNNALVGSGLSLVTLSYLRRYSQFLRSLITDHQDSFNLTIPVGLWLERTSNILKEIVHSLNQGPINPQQRYDFMAALGNAASEYRSVIYQATDLEQAPFQYAEIDSLLENAVQIFDGTLTNNRRRDRLYHTYNLLNAVGDQAQVDTLYPMLEGQVSALSAQSLSPEESIELLSALFDSDMYRADQQTFMLYPDRALTSFLDKNHFPRSEANSIALFSQMLAANDYRLIAPESSDRLRFHADCTNRDVLDQILSQVLPEYDIGDVNQEVQTIHVLYESVFNHHAFTGRSGGMFSFEGLGCVYWHMIGKLLLAVQETYFNALDSGAEPAVLARLAQYYYRIRAGIGFNKTPEEFGAFPTDPYSHTPLHAGAQQPGMTGQVKEEILTRFGELGLRIDSGRVSFQPSLLRADEFLSEAASFKYFSIDQRWETIELAPQSLAFTWCQIPITYQLTHGDACIIVSDRSGQDLTIAGETLPDELSQALFARQSTLRSITVMIPAKCLLKDVAIA